MPKQPSKSKTKPNKGGKAKIVEDIMPLGLTHKKASKAVDTVFEVLARALSWHESVETPIGTFVVTTQKGKPRTKVQKFADINTKKQALKVVKYPGRRKVVKLRPNRELDLTPLPEPETPDEIAELDLTPLPEPETPDEIAARTLASELLGYSADKGLMSAFEEASRARGYRPGALLRRLKAFKDRGWNFLNDPHGLANNLAFHNEI